MPKISVRVDYGVGSFSVSPSSRDVALASRKGLHILDLKEPFSPPRYLSLHSMWEVADVEWSSHPNHPSWIFSTVNQKVIVWDVMMAGSNAISTVLQGHRRAVTHLDLSRLRPDLLASCSIDTLVHIWDLRDPGRPSISLCDFDAGATQVKWSPTDPHIIASAHDNRLMVWDDRKHSIPLLQIPGHRGRINGIDFDPSHPSQILTCSTDCTMKAWNLRAHEPTSPMASVSADFPLWRVQSLPSSTGVFLVPLRKGDNASYLVDLQAIKRKKQSTLDPIAKFAGHQGPIRDFDLCREANGYEILSWSTDGTLKIWIVDGDSLNSVNCRQNLPPLPRQDLTYHTDPMGIPGANVVKKGHIRLHQISREPKSTHLDWIAGIQLGDGNQITKPHFAQPYDGMQSTRGDSLAPTELLSKEVTAVCTKFPKVRFEELNLHNGECTVTARGPWGKDEQLTVLRVNFIFPLNYPNARLECQIEEDPTLEPAVIAELSEHLKTSAQQFALYGKPALEFCLRTLMGEDIPIEMCLNEDATTDPGFESQGDGNILYNSSDEELDYSLDFQEEDSEEGVEDAQEELGFPTDALLGKAVPTRLDSTPLPKNCGAVWAADGRLITFFNILKTSTPEQELPSMDKIFAGEGSSSDSDDFECETDRLQLESSKDQWSTAAASKLSIWWTTKNRTAAARDTPDKVSQAGSTRPLHNRVELRSFVDLMPSRKDLAEEYWFDMKHTAIEMAQHNAGVAERYNRQEEAHIWRLITRYVDTTIPQLTRTRKWVGGFHPAAEFEFFEWSGHPFSNTLAKSINDYLTKTQNVQMMAGIACVIGRYNRPVIMRSRKFIPAEPTDSAVSGEHKLGKLLPYVPFIESNFVISHPPDSVDSAKPDLLTNTKARRNETIPMWPSSSPSPTSEAPTMSPYNSSRLSSISRGLSTTASKSQIFDVENLSTGDWARRDSYFAIPYPESPLNEQRSPSWQRSEAPELPQLHQQQQQQHQHQQQQSDSGGMELFKMKVYNPVNYDRECLDLSMGVSQDSLDISQVFFEQRNRQRNIYASLLERWGLHIQRLELLKFNYAGNYLGSTVSSSGGFGHSNKIGIQFNTQKHHGHTTWNTHRKSCTLCHEPIQKRYLYCQNCTHVMHQLCAEGWWALQTELCPTGCGCNCEQHI